MNDDDLLRFEQQLHHDQDTDCWIWHGSYSRSSSRPAPVFHVGGRTVQAARWIWTAMIGEIPERRFLRLTCGRTGCVNPDHRRISDRRHCEGQGGNVIGPKRPTASQLTIAERLARARVKYQRKKKKNGQPCVECGRIASAKAIRCRECWDRRRASVYGRSPEKALRNRYEAWKRRRRAVVSP